MMVMNHRCHCGQEDGRAVAVHGLVFFVALIAALAAPENARSVEAIPFPGADRAALEIPRDLWSMIQEDGGGSKQPVGYSESQMRQFGRDMFLLPTVLRLFADVSLLPRFSGQVTDELLDDARKIAAFGVGWQDGGLGECARRCYLLLDVSAGRRITPDPPAEAAPPFALEGADRAYWEALPASVRELVTGVYRAAEDARPWVTLAQDQDLLKSITGGETPDRPSDRLYQVAMASRNDEAFGQLVTPEGNTFKLLQSVDLAYLAYATVRWLRQVEGALAAFADGGGVASLAGLSIRTRRLDSPLGTIHIGGTDDAEIHEPAFLVVELGGNDRYGPGLGAATDPGAPPALLIDLSGNDVYHETPDTLSPDSRPDPSFGAGIFGLAALLDLSGSDTYVCGESGLGRGCFGSGILVDFGGDDMYFGAGSWTQGAAHAGIGLLIDLSGNDHYSCARESQGLGATLGVGLLLDLTGDDTYVARDDGNISELYEGQSVAMSQGCGYGRRADLGDGHSLAGGFGLLVDGAGNDTYHAQVWAQGCAYWWGVGILEDRGGDDRYRNGKYSSGAAAHFAIGLHVDLAGDDVYNEGNDTAKNQFQGHARDGSIGVFIDGDGDDRYEFHTHCAGSGDLASIGLFWDRRGADRYGWRSAYRDSSDWATTPPLGSTTKYDPFRSFRDDLPTWGIFIDSGGTDTYDTDGIGADGTSWRMNRYPLAWGIGYDLLLYAQ